MANVIVKLSRRYEVPGQEPFDSITLREPTYRDIFMSGLGEPREMQWANGKPLVITYHDVIDKYLQALMVSPKYDALAVLSAHDALELGEVVCGFFIKPKA